VLFIDIALAQTAMESILNKNGSFSWRKKATLGALFWP